MFVTSYSDFHQPIDEAPKSLKGKRLHHWLLKNLERRSRISVFELEESYHVLKAMMFLRRTGKISLDNTCGYPHLGVSIRGKAE